MMRRILTLAVGTAMALSAITVSASAHDWRGPDYYRHYHPEPTYDLGPAIVAGALFGMAVGALAEPEPEYPPPPPPRYYYPPPPPPPPPVFYPPPAPPPYYRYACCYYYFGP